MANSVHIPPDSLMQATLPLLPLLTVERDQNLHGTRDGQMLHLIRVQSQIDGFQDIRLSFAAVYKPNWTSQSFEIAIKQLHSAGLMGTETLPLLMLPYLDEEKLGLLAEQQISGLDLCGNAFLIIPGHPGKMLVQRSGQPNRFKAERGLKSPYTGKASLVGRTLMVQPQFRTANNLLEFIRAHGGDISQALVSRTLKALIDELVVSNGKGQGIEVLQPAKLLDRLVEGWQTSVGRALKREHRLLWRGRVNLQAGGEVLPVLAARAKAAGQRFTANGLMSSEEWTNLSSGNTQVAYVEHLGDLLSGLDADETRRFPNLELQRPPDEAVYFDTATKKDGSVWASPLQTYLELMTGDARAQQSAPPLRQALLDALVQKRIAPLEASEST